MQRRGQEGLLGIWTLAAGAEGDSRNAMPLTLGLLLSNWDRSDCLSIGSHTLVSICILPSLPRDRLA